MMTTALHEKKTYQFYCKPPMEKWYLENKISYEDYQLSLDYFAIWQKYTRAIQAPALKTSYFNPYSPHGKSDSYAQFIQQKWLQVMKTTETLKPNTRTKAHNTICHDEPGCSLHEMRIFLDHLRENAKNIDFYGG